MNLYDTITQNQLNNIIRIMLYNFNLELNLNLDNLTNNYCDLELDLGDNQDGGNEFIITGALVISLSNVKYSELTYYLKLNYYDLADGDINNSYNYDTLQEKVIELRNGDNTISFDEEIIYLQENCTLIIKDGAN